MVALRSVVRKPPILARSGYYLLYMGTFPFDHLRSFILTLSDNDGIHSLSPTMVSSHGHALVSQAMQQL
jgi:hypothetical protein